MVACAVRDRVSLSTSQLWTGSINMVVCSVISEVPFLYSAVLMCTDVMARGVDIPTVDWVLQFDPPSCAKSAFYTNLA